MDENHASWGMCGYNVSTSAGSRSLCCWLSFARESFHKKLNQHGSLLSAQALMLSVKVPTMVGQYQKGVGWGLSAIHFTLSKNF